MSCDKDKSGAELIHFLRLSSFPLCKEWWVLREGGTPTVTFHTSSVLCGLNKQDPTWWLVIFGEAGAQILSSLYPKHPSQTEHHVFSSVCVPSSFYIHLHHLCLPFHQNQSILNLKRLTCGWSLHWWPSVRARPPRGRAGWPPRHPGCSPRPCWLRSSSWPPTAKRREDEEGQLLQKTLTGRFIIYLKPGCVPISQNLQREPRTGGTAAADISVCSEISWHRGVTWFHASST